MEEREKYVRDLDLSRTGFSKKMGPSRGNFELIRREDGWCGCFFKSFSKAGVESTAWRPYPGGVWILQISEKSIPTVG